MTIVALSIVRPGEVTARAPTSAWYPVPLSRMPVTGSVRLACCALAPTARRRLKLSTEIVVFTKSPKEYLKTASRRLLAVPPDLT